MCTQQGWGASVPTHHRVCLRPMYAQHFGLRQDPFSIAPDPRYLFMSERHREALAHLLFGVAGSGQAGRGAGGGFVLLTGDIGTGKTTICRCFLEQIPAGCHVAYIFNPKLTVPELLQSICEEFHLAEPAQARTPVTVKDYIDRLNAFLLSSHAAGQSCVLIIDEAQNLQSEVLEQLRLLTNLETSERKLLQIVLIGQPELRTMLARPELEQLAQRVIARFHLDALSDAETTDYIAHRLAVSGHQGALPFDAGALGRIRRLARGVPRRINLLCARSLLGAWANGLPRVDRRVVDKAALEVFGPESAPDAVAIPKGVLYALGSVALIGVAWVGYLNWAAPPLMPNSTSAAASAPDLAASAVASTSESAAAATAQGETEEIEPLLALLPTDMNIAWRELAPLWDGASSRDDPCQSAGARPLRCYTASNRSVPQLRQLDRPGLLRLQAGNQAPVYAVLVGLDDTTATLQIASQRHRVRLVSLGRLWRGEFSTFWRMPVGYSPNLKDGSTGPAIDWLARQLGLLDGVAESGGPQTLDGALRARVRAFQYAQGLHPDGQPGPMTFLQLQSATGVDEPRLQAKPR